MKVPQLDLAQLHEPIMDELKGSLESVLRSGRFIGGPEVEEFEKEIAERIGVENAVAVSNGTDAIVCAMQALGVKAGDEVLTSPFTFFATAAAIVRLGAKPVFVDIDPDTFNLRPERVYDYVDDGVINGKKVTDANSEHTKVRAILPVHLYGVCVDMDPIIELAEQFSLMVVEDAAQAILSRYNDKPAGALGDAAAFSFYPSKNLGALGEGGLVTSEDEGVAEAVRILRNHGQTGPNIHSEVAGNYRMNALTAAALRIKARRLNEWTDSRREGAETYNSLFEENSLLDDVILPKVPPKCVTNWHQYAIRVDKRDELHAYLKENEVDSQVYYPVPAHLQPSMKFLGYEKGDLPVAEQAAREVLSLPLFPGIHYEQQEHVVSLVKAFFDANKG